jgi:A/G-specific adenine glycosylase
MELPVKPGKKERRVEDRTILLIEYKDKFALRKRPDKGLLAGLWEFPSLDDQLNISAVREKYTDWNSNINSLEPLGKAKHIFSHVEWHMLGYHIRLKELPAGLSDEYRWADRQELREIYALPNAFAAYTIPLLKQLSSSV